MTSRCSGTATLWLYGLFASWAVAFLASALLGRTSAGAALAGIGSLAMLAFVLVHGAIDQGPRGIARFVALAATISFLLEACSVATGFPFGSYTHLVTTVPKPLGVPPTAVAGYVVLGWLAWSIARILTRADPAQGAGIARWTTPIVATFVLAGFDYPYDPIGSTVLGMWAFHHPSGTFGVPLTNYLGWIFTGWMIFQIFALVERRAPPPAAGRAFWALPCLIWLVVAAQYPLLYLHAPQGLVHQGDRSFVAADVYEAAISAALFSLVLPALAALARLLASPVSAPDPQG